MHIPNPLTVEFSVLFAKAAVEHTVGRVSSLVGPGGMLGVFAQSAGRALARLAGAGKASEKIGDAAGVFDAGEREPGRDALRMHRRAVRAKAFNL